MRTRLRHRPHWKLWCWGLHKASFRQQAAPKAVSTEFTRVSSAPLQPQSSFLRHVFTCVAVTSSEACSMVQQCPNGFVLTNGGYFDVIPRCTRLGEWFPCMELQLVVNKLLCFCRSEVRVPAAFAQVATTLKLATML